MQTLPPKLRARIRATHAVTLPCLLVASLALLSLGGCRTAAPAAEPSPYAGQEHREIKSLSSQDVDDLLQGRGWGLAKAAELNGVPGPLHVLELQEKLDLRRDQVEHIETIRREMTSEAVPLGEEYVELERSLNNRFARRDVSAEGLEAILAEIASVHGQLRFVHLNAHLETLEVLTSDQVAAYNRLRGYDVADPCSNVPEGHDPEMWRRHNGCT